MSLPVHLDWIEYIYKPRDRVDSDAARRVQDWIEEKWMEVKDA